MAFAFSFVGLYYPPRTSPNRWLSADTHEFRLFGRLTEGVVPLDGPIVVPTESGVPVSGTVCRFMETLTSWLGLPFYDQLSVESMRGPFCLVIAADSDLTGIPCPGIARSIPDL